MSGVLLPPPFVVTDRKSQDDGILQWLTVCGSAFLPTSPSLDFPPLYFTTPGHFLAQLDGQRLRNLPVGHDVLSFFFFNKTEQNQKNPRQWCLVDLFTTRRLRITRDGRAVLDGQRTAKGQPVHPPLPCSLFLGGRSVPKVCAACVQTPGGSVMASEGRERAGTSLLGQSYF